MKAHNIFFIYLLILVLIALIVFCNVSCVSQRKKIEQQQLKEQLILHEQKQAADLKRRQVLQEVFRVLDSMYRVQIERKRQDSIKQRKLMKSWEQFI